MTERAESEPVLLRREDLDVALQVLVAGGRAAAFSQRSPGADRDNQDAAALVPLGPHRGVLAVADGAGGHAAGAEASAAAVDAIVSALAESKGSEDGLRPAILDGIERANQRVIEMAGGAATTLALVEIDADTIRPYHVGDSEILVTGQRGRLKLQIVPHSPTGYGVESGLLDAESAIVHEDRHFVSNVVGSREMRIEVGPTIRLQPRDTVLLASDGLFDNLLQEEILEVVRCGPLAKAAEELACATRARMDGAEPRGKPDDLTFVLWRPLPARAPGLQNEERRP